MRQVLSLSLPTQYTEQIKKLSKKRGFSSVSEYIRHLIELDKDLISETTLLNSVKEARKEYKEGKAIEANSLAELV